jgi:tetratricopeptide (TPR) repeat protein
MTGNRDDPRLAFLFYNRGYAKERSGDFGSVLNDYGEALRVNPEYPDAHFAMGKKRASLQPLKQGKRI